jgi:hypothetical protein
MRQRRSNIKKLSLCQLACVNLKILMHLLHQQTACYHRWRDGYVTLVSVLILSAVGLSLAVGLLMHGLGAARNALAIEHSTQARGLAQACAEAGLDAIKLTPNFTGTVNLVFSQGTCTYTITSQAGQNRTVDAIGVVGDNTRRKKVLVTRTTPTIILSAWQEVADF